MRREKRAERAGGAAIECNNIVAPRVHGISGVVMMRVAISNVINRAAKRIDRVHRFTFGARQNAHASIK